VQKMKGVSEESFPTTWSDRYARNVTSQSGEDGILERIFDLIPDGDRWCCEFGAWDGKKYSNTHSLLAHKHWSGVLIEADRAKCIELAETYSGNERAILINKFVAFDGENTLDHILAETAIPHDFDLLSIDIDGNDFHVWASVHQYGPKVVIIEYNPSIPNHIEYIQAADSGVSQGNSILSLTKLAKSKGYQLVAATELNAIFVQSRYFHLFDIADNSLSALRPFSRYVTDIFQLYDGTIVVTGHNRMIWHDVPMRIDKLQVIPRGLRTFPGSMRTWQSLWLKIWKLGLRVKKRK
jgi:hypothetical protein